MKQNPHAAYDPQNLPTDALRNGYTLSRRRLLTQLASGVFVCASGASFAEELVRTPRQTEGPFYPNKMPLDTDNDLLIISNSLTPAVGEVTHLSGRILDSRGEPIRNALVEIWQVDNKGSYIHTQGLGQNGRDPNFQGYGRFLTGSTGEYYFRTIKPVAYPGRTPHIHFAIKVKGQSKFTTQCYVKGVSSNDRDGILNEIRDLKQRASVIVPFAPLKDSKVGELAARFEVVLGYTPGEQG